MNKNYIDIPGSVVGGDDHAVFRIYEDKLLVDLTAKNNGDKASYARPPAQEMKPIDEQNLAVR